VWGVGEEHLEVATQVIPGSGKRQCQRARGHLFDYQWITAFAGMTGEKGQACVRGLEYETIRTDLV
jgi:hypothetical protein